MDCHKFPELPAQLKLQIIQKCKPVAYSRLRRSSKSIDEFCEEYRKFLCVCYCKEGIQVVLEKKEDTPPQFVLLNKESGPIYSLEPRKANKSFSGFLLQNLAVGEFQDTVEEVFDPVLEAVSDLKIQRLHLVCVSAEQARRILESNWQIEDIRCYCTSDIVNISKLDVVKRMKQFRCTVSAENLTVEELAETISGKEYVEMNFFDSFCPVCPLNEIYKSWKKAGNFPIVFEFRWTTDTNFFNQQIDDLCKRIEIADTIYIGSIFATENGNEEIKWDIWMKKEGEKWQLFWVKRYRGSGYFLMYSTESVRDLKKWLVYSICEHEIETTCACCHLDAEKLEKVCVCDPETALEVIKECFDEMVPCALKKKVNKKSKNSKKKEDP